MKSDYLLAGQLYLAESELNRLSESPDSKIRLRIAEHPQTPNTILERLVFDIDTDVRIAVAQRAYCPVYIIDILMKDECVDVRYALAEDSSMPVFLITLLLEDENPYVASRAKETLSRLNGLAKNTLSNKISIRKKKEPKGKSLASDEVLLDYSSNRSPILQKMIGRARKFAIKGKYEAAFALYKTAAEQALVEFGDDSLSYALVLLELSDICESFDRSSELYGLRCKIRDVIKKASAKKQA